MNRQRGVKLPSAFTQLRFHQLFTFSVGFLLGFGWVVMTGPWIAEAGPGGAALAFLAGGLILIPIALCYVEVGSHYPYAGGEFVYAYHAFGKRMAFLAAWLLLFLFIGLAAFETIAAAWIVSLLLPVASGPELYRVQGFSMTAGMLVVMTASVACITQVNYRGSASMARAQDWAAYVLIILAAAIIVSGFVGGHVRNLEPLMHSPNPHWLLQGVFGVFATTPIWYCGLNALPQALSELDERPTSGRLARLVVQMLIGSAVFYVLLILSTGMAAPRSVLIEADFATSTAMAWAYSSPLAAQVVLVAGFLGVVTTWNAAHYAAARILFALARARLLPQVFARTHPRYGSPQVAILFVGGVSLLGALGGTSMLGTFVSAGVIVASALFFITCLALFRMRGRGPDRAGYYKVPAYPWVPGFALFYAACTIGFGLFVTWKGRGSRDIPVEWLILASWGVLGVLLWRAGKAIRETLTEQARGKLIRGEELTDEKG